jgi:hypothetical protein
MSEYGKEAPYIKKRRDAERKQQERQQHEDNVQIVSALHRVADELRATEQQDETSDRKKGFRGRGGSCAIIPLISINVPAKAMTVSLFLE